MRVSATHNQNCGVSRILSLSLSLFLCQVYGDAVLDRNMMSSHFDLLSPPSTRDLLFVEYLEELISAVVGPLRVMRFLVECFQGQTYRITHIQDEEHERLWRHT